MDFNQFCRRHHIRAEAVMVDENPNMSDMPEGSYHWKVTLKRPGRGFGGSDRKQLTVPFSMGPALDHEPEAHEVLSCLVSDSFGADEDFEGWAANLGYDPDSRKAEKIWHAVRAQTKRLRQFLSGDLFDLAQHCEE
jgi:hypothetical protein